MREDRRGKTATPTSWILGRLSEDELNTVAKATNVSAYTCKQKTEVSWNS